MRKSVVLVLVVVVALIALVPLTIPQINLNSSSLAYGLIHLIDRDVVRYGFGGAAGGAVVWAATRLGVRLGGTVGGFFGAVFGGAAAAL